MYRPFHNFHQQNRFNSHHPPNSIPYFINDYTQNTAHQHVINGTSHYQEHWCETCDRDFPSAASLESHKNLHQKCNIDGCQFIAHPKVVTKHIQMQHSSGLYNKISKLVNPEEIQKWREDRKKRYPTKSNIDKKLAEVKEKIERGEKMCLFKDRKCQKSFTDYKRRHIERKHNVKQNRPVKFPLRKCLPQKAVVISEPSEIRKLKPFTGIQHLIFEDLNEEENLDIDKTLIDDDDCDNVTIAETQPALCGALNNLLCNYMSSDDESDVANSINKSSTQIDINPKIVHEKVTDNNSEKNVDNIPGPKITPKPENSKDMERKLGNNDPSDSADDSGPEEVKTTKIEDVSETLKEEKVIINKVKSTLIEVKNKDRIIRNINTIRKPKVPSTLLQKLLHREIRQERNIVLQCVKYILNNNYFDK